MQSNSFSFVRRDTSRADTLLKPIKLANSFLVSIFHTRIVTFRAYPRMRKCSLACPAWKKASPAWKRSMLTVVRSQATSASQHCRVEEVRYNGASNTALPSCSTWSNSSVAPPAHGPWQNTRSNRPPVDKVSAREATCCTAAAAAIRFAKGMENSPTNSIDWQARSACKASARRSARVAPASRGFAA